MIAFLRVNVNAVSINVDAAGSQDQVFIIQSILSPVVFMVIFARISPCVREVRMAIR